jgi:ABC-type siderophore export system fused ATPase/permease subunit
VQRRLYLQFVAVMTAALLLSPIWLKYALWLIGAVLLALWMKQMTKELLGTQLLKLLGLQQADRLGALKKTTAILTVSGTMLLSLLLGLLITWGSIWYVVVSGVLVCAAAGVLLGRAAAHLATYFSG